MGLARLLTKPTGLVNAILPRMTTLLTTPQTLALTAQDGYAIAASHFAAPGDQFIVVASATAVPRWFYAKFAEYAQSLGINVITTDYRGIGDSKYGSLKGFDMDYADWSRYDLAAAVAYAAQRGRVWLVGHSLGGHAIGQLPQPNLLQAAYVCGVGSGWHGWMPRPERYRAWAMWNLLGPITTRMYGYHPMSKFGMGEDIPMGVYRDWKRWCANPHYFFDDTAPKARAITAKFADVRIPIAAVVSTDDLWAPPVSRDAFFKGYSNASVEPIDLTPQGLGVQQIGHMGYYRSQVGVQLWPQMLAWLAQHGLQTTNA
jgi:predicted alpha/beta hydrolase